MQCRTRHNRESGNCSRWNRELAEADQGIWRSGSGRSRRRLRDHTPRLACSRAQREFGIEILRPLRQCVSVALKSMRCRQFFAIPFASACVGEPSCVGLCSARTHSTITLIPPHRMRPVPSTAPSDCSDQSQKLQARPRSHSPRTRPHATGQASRCGVARAEHPPLGRHLIRNSR